VESPRYEGQGLPPEKASGVVTFRYANKSTSADLQVDLGSTDVHLEMTGRPAEQARAAAGQGADQDAPRADASRAGQETRQPHSSPDPAGRPMPPAPGADKPRPEPDTEEEESGPDQHQDVTDKVLQGIRKAQEYFYQKRYPEALQMVRQSLEARPTAEGHALSGSIHYMMGATGLARRHWQQALRLNPDMPAVTHMLERIATPGGRGSPHPRPLPARRAPRAPSPSVLEAANPGAEAPFPEEYADPPSDGGPSPSVTPVSPAAAPAPVPASAPKAPAAQAAPGAPAPAVPAPAVPAPAVPAAAPASTAASPPAAQAPAAAPSPRPVPAATPAESAGSPAAPAAPSPAPAKAASAPAAATPAPETAKPAPASRPSFPRKQPKDKAKEAAP
jgi:hypothetical protein